jgi:galacturan 1,4-alpha-galacturonidase
MKISSQLIATLCLPLAVLATTSHPTRLSERPQLEIGPKSLAKPHLTSAPRNKTCIVDDSAEDDAPAILAAAEECNNGGILLFPEGVTYSVGTRLNLTFLQSVDLDIQGTIQVTTYCSFLT